MGLLDFQSRDKNDDISSLKRVNIERSATIRAGLSGDNRAYPYCSEKGASASDPYHYHTRYTNQSLDVIN